MKKTALIYLTILGVFGAAIFWVIHQGQQLPVPHGEVGSRALAGHSAVAGEVTSLWGPLKENLKEPLSRLFLQVIVIVVATRLVGALFGRFGQPSVVGEVLAGILLGPSLLGWCW